MKFCFSYQNQDHKEGNRTKTMNSTTAVILQPTSLHCGTPPDHARPDRFPSGARCRVCSKIYGKDQFDNVQFCEDHNASNNSEEARLGRIAVSLQEAFMPRCVNFREALGWSSAEECCEAGTPPRSLSEAQWWKWVVTFHRMCELSHRDLAEPLRGLKDGRRFEGE